MIKRRLPLVFPSLTAKLTAARADGQNEQEE
jgi:hypothetical protein